MELCNIDKLNLIAIRAMLERNKEVETLEKLIIVVST